MAESAEEVVQSLFKPGTRYRSEKFAVLIVYVVVAGLTIVWVAEGVEKEFGLAGTFEVRKVEHLEDQNFVLNNTGQLAWRDVRVALNDEYLAKLDVVKSGTQKILGPEDFRYYYYVPRRWGTETWETLADGSKPGAVAPGDLKVERIDVHCRRGEVDVEYDRGS
ncbi:MAG: hypothetical protein ABEL76_11945 [Bradymonadaceae bacterium]